MDILGAVKRDKREPGKTMVGAAGYIGIESAGLLNGSAATTPR